MSESYSKKVSNQKIKSFGRGSGDIAGSSSMYEKMRESIFGFTFLSSYERHSLSEAIYKDFKLELEDREKKFFKLQQESFAQQLTVDYYLMFRYRMPVLHYSGVVLMHFDAITIAPINESKDLVKSMINKSINKYNIVDTHKTANFVFEPLVKKIKALNKSHKKDEVFELIHEMLDCINEYCSARSINFSSLINNFVHSNR